MKRMPVKKISGEEDKAGISEGDGAESGTDVSDGQKRAEETEDEEQHIEEKKDEVCRNKVGGTCETK